MRTTETIRPLGEWVLMQPMPLEQQTPGGLYIPQNSKRRTYRGTVLAVGPGKVLESGRRVEPEVKAGDLVIYLEHNIAQGVGDPKNVDETQLIPASEILAVVE